MLDEDTQEVYFEIAIGAGAERLRDVRLKLGEGVAGWVAQHGEPCWSRTPAKMIGSVPRSMS